MASSFDDNFGNFRLSCETLSQCLQHMFVSLFTRIVEVLRVLSKCYEYCRRVTSIIDVLRVLSKCYEYCRSVTSIVEVLRVLSKCYEYRRSVASIVEVLRVLSKCCEYCRSVTSIVEVLRVLSKCCEYCRSVTSNKQRGSHEVSIWSSHDITQRVSNGNEFSPDADRW